MNWVTRGMGLGAALFVAGPAAAQAIELGAADGQAKALVEASMAASLREGRSAGAEVTLFTARADLNGDRAPEVIAQISSGYHCAGAGGCPMLIFRNDGPNGFRKVAEFMSDGLDLLPTQSGGWRDLKSYEGNNQRRLRWTGAVYR